MLIQRITLVISILVLIKNNEYINKKLFRYYTSIRTSGEVTGLSIRDNEVICTLL
ncbi:MAG: hypothetical protein RLZZ540_3139 [Bacteroidota bacterium]|jgi:hypothetical protein